jgi:hypothetical protein
LPGWTLRHSGHETWEDAPEERMCSGRKATEERESLL